MSDRPTVSDEAFEAVRASYDACDDSFLDVRLRAALNAGLAQTLREHEERVAEARKRAWEAEHRAEVTLVELAAYKAETEWLARQHDTAVAALNKALEDAQRLQGERDEVRAQCEVERVTGAKGWEERDRLVAELDAARADRDSHRRVLESTIADRDRLAARVRELERMEEAARRTWDAHLLHTNARIAVLESLLQRCREDLLNWQAEGPSDPDTSKLLTAIDAALSAPARPEATKPRWPTVDAFTAVMRAKLDANADKGGWDYEDQTWLLDRLDEESKELRAAYGDSPATGKGIAAWRKRIADEAADVANFAMMVADVCGALQPAPAQPGARREERPDTLGEWERDVTVTERMRLDRHNERYAEGTFVDAFGKSMACGEPRTVAQLEADGWRRVDAPAPQPAPMGGRCCDKQVRVNEGGGAETQGFVCKEHGWRDVAPQPASAEPGGLECEHAKYRICSVCFPKQPAAPAQAERAGEVAVCPGCGHSDVHDPEEGCLNTECDCWADWPAAHAPPAEPTPAAPVPMVLTCPRCRARHIDEGEFATKVHHTHSCQACGHTWRPAVVPTVGVQFLPGFKNDVPAAPVADALVTRAVAEALRLVAGAVARSDVNESLVDAPAFNKALHKAASDIERAIADPRRRDAGKGAP